MPYKDENRNSYKICVRWNGRTLRAGCGTTQEKVADAIEEMVRQLKHDRRHLILDAILSRQLKLSHAYSLYTNDKLLAWTPEVSSVDLVPLIDVWTKGVANMHGGEIPGTVVEYEKQIRAMLGAHYLARDFTSKRISIYLHDMTVSGSTRNRVHTALSVFANYLTEREVLGANPLRDVARFPENAGREIWFDEHDSAKLLVNTLPMPHRAVVALMLATGMECQAVWRLRRRMVQFGARPTVHARGSKKPWRNRIIEPTDMWMWRVFEKYARNFLPEALVFADVPRDTVLDYMQDAMKVSGLAELEHAPERLHDLRHIYACFALKDGWPLHIVSRQLGHRDTVLAQRLYARFIPSMADYDLYRPHARLAGSKARKGRSGG